MSKLTTPICYSELSYIAPKAVDDEVRMMRHQTVQNHGVDDPFQPVKAPVQPALMPTPIQTFGGVTSAQSGCGCLPAGSTAVRYWLEDVDLNGKSSWNGPFETTSALAKNPAEALRQSLLLSQLGLREAMLANGPGSQPRARTALLAAPTAGALQAQSALASQSAVKLAIKQAGLYRVTQSQLLAAGIDPRVDPRSLQVFVDGVEQPIKVMGEQDGRFDPSDMVEFYATGLDVPSTDTRVYWLVAGAQPGKRINTTSAKGGLSATDGAGGSASQRQRLH